MGKHSISILTTYVLIAMGLLIHNTIAVDGTEIDSVNISEDDQKYIYLYELIERQLYQILKNNQRLFQYIAGKL